MDKQIGSYLAANFFILWAILTKLHLVITFPRPR
jgi:hypothetical protein